MSAGSGGETIRAALRALWEQGGSASRLPLRDAALAELDALELRVLAGDRAQEALRRAHELLEDESLHREPSDEPFGVQGCVACEAMAEIERGFAAAGGREPTLIEPGASPTEGTREDGESLTDGRASSLPGSLSAGGREPGQATAGGDE